LKKLLLGLGNEILTDDGIGLRLISDMEKVLSIPGLEYRSSALGGLELLDIIRDYDEVVVVDALKTGTHPPGTVLTFIPEDFRDTLHLSNLHDINFLTALKLGKMTGMKIPGRIHIIAIEIVEDRVFATSFTPVIADLYPKILEEVTFIAGNFLGQS
jgi:hydrogenase maturation protease